MKRIRVMQESLTQKHLAIDSEMLKNAGRGDDGKLGSRLIEITSEVSLSSPSELLSMNQCHECINQHTLQYNCEIHTYIHNYIVVVCIVLCMKAYLRYDDPLAMVMIQCH